MTLNNNGLFFLKSDITNKKFGVRVEVSKARHFEFSLSLCIGDYVYMCFKTSYEPFAKLRFFLWYQFNYQRYSSSVSPFQAKTGIPLAAIAAAAWSCVEKMLHDDQVISAPNSIRVSIKTAVWIVIWRQPAILAPLRGFEGPYFLRKCINPGISFSANVSSFLPNSARLMSAENF